MEFFTNPQNPVEMLTGKETQISSQYHQVKTGGDIAALMGLCKHVLAKDDEAKAQGRSVLDRDFIKNHTSGFEAFEQRVRSTGWDEIVHAFAVSQKFSVTPAVQYNRNITTDADGSWDDGDFWRAGVTLDYQVVPALSAKATATYVSENYGDHTLGGKGDADWFEGFFRLERGF